MTEFFHRYCSKLDEPDPDVDYFARCLLMPREYFIREFDRAKVICKDTSIIGYLCGVFGVPFEQCELRIRELELV
ncbi:MAG: hypothetical protein HDQ88_05825 [Clostridia bacterium]|nr:hypothetical protein [Clostridia bacterium]